MMTHKVELLAPAGSLEKLKMAVLYGADAVYIGGAEYGLRAGAENFSDAEIGQGIEFAHARGRKVYVTMNFIPHNDDLEGLPEFAARMQAFGADAAIVADPGVFEIVRENAPDLPIHISTQANVTNHRTAAFWSKMGASRVIAARELSLEELAAIRLKCPHPFELEIFVHGAMCISYSGRCLISSYMTGRDSNRGKCAHPCRWSYSLTEEKRPGEYYPVEENERGTYFFNSKDLNLIRHIPELIGAGIDSFKIEGRMKSSFYAATVVKAWREAIDAYYADGPAYEFDERLYDELCKVSHRKFTTGFVFPEREDCKQTYKSSSYERDYDFVGIVLEHDPKSGIAKIEQRNKFCEGDLLEIVNPTGPYFEQVARGLIDADGMPISSVPHPQMIFYMKTDRPVVPFSMLRMQNKSQSS